MHLGAWPGGSWLPWRAAPLGCVFPHITVGFLFSRLHPAGRRPPSSAVVRRRPPPRSLTHTHHKTYLIIHKSCHIIHNSSHITHHSSHTQLISHNTSHTDNSQHHSSHTTHPTQQLISHTTHLTHNSSHTPRLSHTTHLFHTHITKPISLISYCEKSVSTFYCPSLSQTSTVGKVSSVKLFHKLSKNTASRKPTKTSSLQARNYQTTSAVSKTLPGFSTPNKTAKAQARSKVPLPSSTSG